MMRHVGNYNGVLVLIHKRLFTFLALVFTIWEIMPGTASDRLCIWAYSLQTSDTL